MWTTIGGSRFTLECLAFLLALGGPLLALEAIQPTPLTRTRAYVVWLVALIGAMVAGGIALAIGFRWGWPPASLPPFGTGRHDQLSPHVRSVAHRASAVWPSDRPHTVELAGAGNQGVAASS